MSTYVQPSITNNWSSSMEHGKPAFALAKYEQAVDFYATALEFVTKKFGDDAPETVDLYFSYRKAPLENAISNSGVLGKTSLRRATRTSLLVCACATRTISLSLTATCCRIVVREWADLVVLWRRGGHGGRPAVDLFSATLNMEDADEAAAEEGEDRDDTEPEDDFNAAWEVLDLARAIYAKQSEEAADDEDVWLKLADTYVALGDVSLETGALQAEHGARLTSGRLGDAISHAECALESIESQLAELANSPAPTPAPAADSAPAPDPKGKGKATGTRLVRDDLRRSKELLDLKEDLALKELKRRPDEPMKNAWALAVQALDAELNGGRSVSVGQVVVNDLTSTVVKRKNTAPAPDASTSSLTKRKAEEDGGSSAGKKVKLDEPWACVEYVCMIFDPLLSYMERIQIQRSGEAELLYLATKGVSTSRSISACFRTVKRATTIRHLLSRERAALANLKPATGTWKKRMLCGKCESIVSCSLS
ncbi:hypothetical protein C8J57DRAFT_1213569 [Mycena rebaudengoi]|nr:hypothetical protein C8J57DRAFT_1213569 [Mycena rebaudengoi]